jgi:hypothetical protein
MRPMQQQTRGTPRRCLGATPLVGELPRSNRQTTAWPAAPSREADKNGEARGPEFIKSKFRRPEPLRRARLFGTHAPGDKENHSAVLHSGSTA